MMLPHHCIDLLLYLRDQKMHDSEIFELMSVWCWAIGQDGIVSGARKDCTFEQIL
jgi:hypothetical protein